MEFGDDLLEKHSWTLIDAFFEKNGTTSQQIESYNDFVDNKIPQIIRDSPPIEIVDSAGRRHIFKLHPAEQPLYFPVHAETDFTLTPLFPNTARLRNLSYSSNLYVTIEWKHMAPGEIMKIEEIESAKKRFIGKIPVMVRSKYCRLSRLKTDNEHSKIGECPLDPGGYFIINGKERVILTQERAAENTVFVFPKYSNSRSVLECEIRAANENSSTSASAFWIRLENERVKNSPKIGKKNGKTKNLLIKVKFPGLMNSVPISHLYQAIGFTSVSEVYTSIMEVCSRNKVESQEGVNMIFSILEKSFTQWENLTPEQAKEKIGEFYRRLQKESILREVSEFDAEENLEKLKNEQLQYVETMLVNSFLPNLNKSENPNKDKGYMLSYMVWKLLMVYTGQLPKDDRDHLQNKRYFTSGYLLSQLFSRAINFLTQELRMNLRRKLMRKTGVVDISTAFMPSALTLSLAHSLATGNWATTKAKQDKQSRIYSNVTQELNRYTRNSHLSSLRRLNSPEDKLQLMVRPRQLHNTYFGLICPFETPEGMPIGLVKNMALLCQITINTPYDSMSIHSFVMTQIEGIIELKEAIQTQLYEKEILTKVFIEGRWVGFARNPVSFVTKFREARRVGQFSSFVSISWEHTDRIIDIRTGAGRLCRPLLVIQNNKLLFNQSHVQRLKDGKMNWIDCIREGIVEIIDVRESESTLIAMDYSKLKENKDRPIKYNYTHMEIHPAMMVGICASIPFANHSQSPRIVYQSGIAKQAMGLYDTNFLSRMDTTSHFLHYCHKPIVNNIPMKYFDFEKAPAGAICITAIGTYNGYNMEDSIILNKTSVERGLFRSTMFQTFSDKGEAFWEDTDDRVEEFFVHPEASITKGVRTCSSKNDNYRGMKFYKNLDSDGLPSPGTRYGVGLEPNEEEAIIGKVKTLSKKEIGEHVKKVSRTDTQGLNVVTSDFLYRDASTFIRKPLSSIVDKAIITSNAQGEKVVKVRTRTQLLPQIGDKFSSLHGQKGVVGMEYHDVDMPFTREGIVPDIIMNPHGIPSRMTIGQLYESLYGKAGCLAGRVMDGTIFHKRNIDEIGRILRNHNYQPHGMEVMYCGYTGRKMNSTYFIGPTFYQRLKHLVHDKIHSRARGNIDILTQQPVKGFSREGGLRFGEMERDCLISHGASLFLTERFMDVSDGRVFPICGACGSVCSVRLKLEKSKKIVECIRCRSFNEDSRSIIESKIYYIKMPYAAKLFFQELMCIGITPRIIPSNRDSSQIQPSSHKPLDTSLLLSQANQTVTKSLIDSELKDGFKHVIPLQPPKSSLLRDKDKI